MVIDEQTGNWVSVRRRIVRYTSDGKKHKRKVWYDKRRKLYIKMSNYYDSGLYTRITKLAPKAYPDMLVSHHHTKYSMTFTYKPIPGRDLTSWRVHWTEELYDQVYQWLCDELDRTWPIVHGDWSPSNIIQNTDGFHMIDYDDIYYAIDPNNHSGDPKRNHCENSLTDSQHKDQIRKTIREHLAEGVPYLKLPRNS